METTSKKNNLIVCFLLLKKKTVLVVVLLFAAYLASVQKSTISFISSHSTAIVILGGLWFKLLFEAILSPPY